LILEADYGWRHLWCAQKPIKTANFTLYYCANEQIFLQLHRQSWTFAAVQQNIKLSEGFALSLLPMSETQKQVQQGGAGGLASGPNLYEQTRTTP
jgi:hypothetical protein